MPYKANSGCFKVSNKADKLTPMMAEMAKQDYMIRLTRCGFFAPTFWLVKVIAP